jgi:hypothetical protein
VNPSVRHLAWSVFWLFVAGPACSGVVENNAPHADADAGRKAGGGRDAAVSDHGRAGDGDASSGVGPDGGVPPRSCEELTASAQRLYDAIDADSTCTVDADCADGPRPPCVPGCGFTAVSNKGVSMLQGAVDEARLDCNAFANQMCPIPALPCVAQVGQPACLRGRCATFIPESWPSMTLVESNVPFQLECTTSDDCTSFTVTPSGGVFSNGPAGGKQFDATALATVRSIADDIAFRQGFITGFGCAASTSRTYVTLSREFSNGAKASQDVTGCILVGPPQNQPRTLWDLFQSLGGERDGGAAVADGAATD